ncbi:hypothetical protein A0J61_03907 [Choanephora cucurbitarum]|uniref:Uncharacterized protein n=1 Tax=Choanephora cucurbitarum TaxID=101091 RepID=A0A1C7NHM7_9FUNG|nr:hypothetical protein A0J61_03907 [Choanephora cucurbitarum]
MKRLIQCMGKEAKNVHGIVYKTNSKKDLQGWKFEYDHFVSQDGLCKDHSQANVYVSCVDLFACNANISYKLTKGLSLCLLSININILLDAREDVICFRYCQTNTQAVATITNCAVESERKASEQQANVVHAQARLQELRSLKNELQSQIEAVLPSPVVYSTKSKPKNITNEKIWLTRELKGLSLKQTGKRRRQSNAFKVNVFSKRTKLSAIVKPIFPLSKGLSKGQAVGHFDSKSEGNYGHRAISCALYNDESLFENIKNEMLSYLRHDNVFYKYVFGSSPHSNKALPSTYGRIEQRLTNKTDALATGSWLQFPEMV